MKHVGFKEPETFFDSPRKFGVATSSEHTSIGGVRIDAMDFRDVVGSIIVRAGELRPNAYVVTPNAHHIVLLQNNERFRKIYEQALLVVPDGVPLLWAAKVLGQKLFGRVNGTDLLEVLCAEAATRGFRVFLLGGREGAADAAAAVLRKRHPALTICGTYCPRVGFETDAEENGKIVRTINEAHADLLFVGLGAPKQEYWMFDNRERLNARVSLGIGVSFEFIAGVVKRAPYWMQVAGLEWFYRLFSEPKRLWKRYTVGNGKFCMIIAKEFIQRLSRRRVRTL
jgi:N-acetylglucosaminyldiphosphoundecaprenol N-acetyl-beta-D-mannosaminyltransferase